MGRHLTVVLDTSALVWWTTDPPRLSERAGNAIDRATEILVNAISIWEIGLKSKNGTLILPESVREYARGLRELARLAIRPTDVDTWIASLELDWDHKDPADRVIVATARLAQAPLVTSDGRILDYYSRAIW